MNRIIPASILIVSLALLAACGGASEATYEDVASKEQSIFAREARVESSLCQHPEVMEIWEEWADQAGSRLDNYENLSNSQKMDFLNEFDDVLDKLEDKGKKVC